MGSRYFGHCPACQHRIDLGVDRPSHGACPACAAPFLVFTPPALEPGGPAQDLEITLVRRPLPPWPERLKDVPRLSLVLAAALLGLFVLFMGLAMAGQDSLFYVGLRVLIDAAELTLVSAVPFTLLLGWRRRTWWKSLVALALGGLLLSMTSGVFGAVNGPLADRATSGLLLQILLGGAVGWTVARSAPHSPYRHSLALGITAAAGTLGLVLASQPTQEGTLLVSTLQVVLWLPAMLAGAAVTQHGPLRRVQTT